MKQSSIHLQFPVTFVWVILSLLIEKKFIWFILRNLLSNQTKSDYLIKQKRKIDIGTVNKMFVFMLNIVIIELHNLRSNRKSINKYKFNKIFSLISFFSYQSFFFNNSINTFFLRRFKF